MVLKHLVMSNGTVHTRVNHLKNVILGGVKWVGRIALLLGYIGVTIVQRTVV